MNSWVAGVLLGSHALTISPHIVRLAVGAHVQLSADQAVTWRSSDPAIVDISATGLVTAVSLGDAAVVADDDDNDEGRASVTVTNELGYHNTMAASIVVGQPDFVSEQVNQGGGCAANTLNYPGQLTIVDHHLLVADGQNNRFLIYNSIPTQNNVSADEVIGQSDFTSCWENRGPPYAPHANTIDRAAGLATDGVQVFALDRDNHRLLIFDHVPESNGANADRVVGQNSLDENSWYGESVANNTAGVSGAHFSSGPTGVAYDEPTKKLVVYDSDNDRVLIFNAVPTTNGVSADVVVGQPDLTSNATNQGGHVGANTLDIGPGAGVTTYQGKLIIADRANNRVLVFNTIPAINNASADVVIGQTDFTSNLPNQGGAISRQSLWHPRAARVDADGRLFIADGLNNRVLIYNTIPTQNGALPDFVVGQPDFTTGNDSPVNEQALAFPGDILFFPDHMIIDDNHHHRLLIYDVKVRECEPAPCPEG